MKALHGDEQTHLPYLLELLSVKDSGIDKILLTPDARKNRIVEAFQWILLKKAQSRPLVILFEDLHWMDKSSEDTLRPFLEVVPGTRVLIILTYRPDFIPAWGTKSCHTQIALNRLSKGESLVMISQLLGGKSLSRELEELILEKTEGVPLLIEEFIRSFKDLAGHGNEEPPLPASDGTPGTGNSLRPSMM